MERIVIKEVEKGVVEISIGQGLVDVFEEDLVDLGKELNCSNSYNAEGLLTDTVLSSIDKIGSGIFSI